MGTMSKKHEGLSNEHLNSLSTKQVCIRAAELFYIKPDDIDDYFPPSNMVGREVEQDHDKSKTIKIQDSIISTRSNESLIEATNSEREKERRKEESNVSDGTVSVPMEKEDIDATVSDREDKDDVENNEEKTRRRTHMEHVDHGKEVEEEKSDESTKSQRELKTVYEREDREEGEGAKDRYEKEEKEKEDK